VATGRRRARKEALFFLYQQDLLGLTREDAVIRRSAVRPEEMDPYQRRLVEGVAEHRAEIDSELGRRLEGWTLERLAPLERNLLRLGLFELRWASENPPAVTISEAVELAKRYCSDEAARLVNGVLGALATEERS